jgi:hypothetical protein
LDIQTGKVFSIKVTPSWVYAELSADVVIELDDVSSEPFEKIRARDLDVFSYDGEFSIDVIFAMMNQLRQDDIYPAYIAVSPGTFLKKDPHWGCAHIDGITERRFMGMVVLEEPQLDEDTIIIAGCTGTEPRVYTIEKSVKAVRNDTTV